MSSKISNLTDGTTANATDRIPVSRSGANRFITPAYIATYAASVYGLLALCKTATDITYTTSPTRINFATKTYDPGSAVTTGASWVYTVPATGYYKFELYEFDVDGSSSNWTAGDIVKVYLYKNSASYLATLGQREFDAAITYATLSDFYLPVFSVTVPLTAADTVYAEFRNNTASSRKLYAGGSIAISRVA